MRDTYADVGAAIRQANHRAAASATELTRADWRVLTAIIALVASYSRLQDTITAEQIAGAAAMDTSTAKKALAHLVELGIITRTATRGRHAAATGLPPATVATVATVHHTATVATPATVPGPNRGDTHHGSPPGNRGDSRPATVATVATHPRRKPEKTARAHTRAHAPARETTAPAGSACGRPAPHPTTTQDAITIDQALTANPQLFANIANPNIRNILERVARPRPQPGPHERQQQEATG